MKEQSSDLNDMLEKVKQFHEKNNFEIYSENRETMFYRMNILMEELGEIAQCLTKGSSKQQLAEEHADLFILLLGNCLTMDMDLAKAFWKKMDTIMQRPSKKIGNQHRVSNWK